MRIPIKWAAAVPVAGLLALACCFAADPKEKAVDDSGRFVVHEWGTFSTFSGSDGKNLKFNPYDNDLPDFVHHYLERDSKAGPRGGTISLETPVIYFYPDRPMTASVKVEFPKGTITEWYPHAQRTESKLVWKDFSIQPREDMELPHERKASRYYAARETDAAPLRVRFPRDDRLVSEYDKFLFYRGVGDFDLPLWVRALGDDKFQIFWHGRTTPVDLVLVRVHHDRVRFRPIHLDKRLKGGLLGDVQLPAEDSTADKLGELLVKQLTGRGLKEKEALAMVKTWRSAWFGEEGTRVLYLLPDELTDELLPLRVEPKPTSLVRVLVGRHDVLTPEQEQQIDSWVAKLTRVSPENERNAAMASLAKLGRYESAAYTAAEARLKGR
jgi:hypothetical protein